jgi:hypothetical protein
MVSPLIVLFSIVLFILAAMTLYIIYCMISLVLFKRKIKKNPEEIRGKSGRFNLFIKLIKRNKRVLQRISESTTSLIDEVNKKVNKYCGRLGIIVVVLFRCIVAIVVIIIALTAVELGLNAVTTVCNIIINKDKEEDKGEDKKEDIKEDSDWVEVVGDSESESSYKIKLSDGSFYWYHQTSSFDNCVFCGDWTAMKWGTEANNHAFGKDGCAVYSLAIAISNATGTEVTPRKLLEDVLESKIIKTPTGLLCLTDSRYFASGSDKSGRLIKYSTVANKVKEYFADYNMNIEIINGDNISVNNVDSILDKGGYFWCSYSGGPASWYSGSCHYMVIRSMDKNNYYKLDSCSTVEKMNNGTNKNDVVACARDTGFAIYATPIDKSYNTEGSWYSDANKVAKYTSKTKLEDNIYLYDGLPWEAASTTYVLDTELATTSIVEYINKTSETTLNTSSLTGWGKNRWSKEFSGAYLSSGKGFIASKASWSKNSSYTYYTNIDGVSCVGFAPQPAVVDRGYCDNFKFNTWQTQSTPASDLYGYATKKIAIIIQKNDSGKIYYLPATPADSKGHTFPGGVFQTNCKIAGSDGKNYNVKVAETSGDSSGGTQLWKYKELAYKMNTTLSAGSSIVAYIYGICETNGWSNSLWQTITSSYKVIGYVVW